MAAETTQKYSTEISFCRAISQGSGDSDFRASFWSFHMLAPPKMGCIAIRPTMRGWWSHLGGTAPSYPESYRCTCGCRMIGDIHQAVTSLEFQEKSWMTMKSVKWIKQNHDNCQYHQINLLKSLGIVEHLDNFDSQFLGISELQPRC